MTSPELALTTAAVVVHPVIRELLLQVVQVEPEVWVVEEQVQMLLQDRHPVMVWQIPVAVVVEPLVQTLSDLLNQQELVDQV